jgi:hypothetical protein
MLDKHRVVRHRLFREACLHHKGNYVKDLSLLGRELKNVIIVDNSPASYLFHRSNAIPITSWFYGPEDRELLDLVPFLVDLERVEDVTSVLGTLCFCFNCYFLQTGPCMRHVRTHRNRVYIYSRVGDDDSNEDR